MNTILRSKIIFLLGSFFIVSSLFSACGDGNVAIEQPNDTATFLGDTSDTQGRDADTSSPNPDTQEVLGDVIKDVPSDDTLSVDTGGGDTADPDTADPDTADPDAPPTSGCEQLEVYGDWRLDGEDDVSIQYSVAVTPPFEIGVERIALLFERYNPGPNIGVFTLGEGGDSNYGNCEHCVFMSSSNPARGFFADQGALTLVKDPYSRTLEGSLENLRFIEVTVDLETRASTPLEDGRCVEITNFQATGHFPKHSWSCAPERFGDGEYCDCNCGSVDPDCNIGGGCPPFDPSCVPSEPLPVEGCGTHEFCSFNPITEGMICIEVCDWRTKTPCSTGVCVFDDGVNGQDTCREAEERMDRLAGVGDLCAEGNYQLVCNIQEEIALGYCGPENICRAVCESDTECSDPEHTCRRFLGIDGLGYCGPLPPEDG